MYLRPIACGLAALAVACGTEDTAKDSSVPLTELDREWAAYEIEPPPAEIDVWLNGTPFLFPEQVCVPADSVANLDPNAERTILEDGTEAICYWDAFSGNVPEGLDFTDFSTCELAWTQGPPWFSPPERVHRSDDSLLDDPAYVTELEWVRDQVRTSGCACCHASGVESGHTSGFDMDAPGVWTDSMTNAQLAMGAGLFPEQTLFGHFEMDVNHGFDRTQTLFASTDPDRMAAFFQGEFDRRGGSDEDLAEAQNQYTALFGRLFEDFTECIDPFEGLVDGTLTWNSDTPVRQVYVLELDAETPGFPPNLDRPAGTVWALYVDPTSEAIAPARLALGEVPAGTTQMVPETGALALESGRTYRLYATPDIMIPSQVDCTFVAP